MTARARDATFYALRFLSQVLLSDHHPPFGTSQSSNSPAGSSHSNPHQPHQSPMSQHGRSPSQHHAQHHGSHIKAFSYSARDDYLLNRPWVLYFACLIVWSYGFALDGPIRPLYKLESHNEVVEDIYLCSKARSAWNDCCNRYGEACYHTHQALGAPEPEIGFG